MARDPLQLLLRGYLLRNPNATKLYNSSLLWDGLDAEWMTQWREGGIADLQATHQSSVSDRWAIKLDAEGLFDSDTANATLSRSLGFLLPHANESVVAEAVAAAQVPLHKAISEQRVGILRRHQLLRILQRKATKCNHVAQVQQKTGYTPISCEAMPNGTAVNHG